MIGYGNSPYGELGIGRTSKSPEFAQTVLKEELDIVQVGVGVNFTILLIRDNPPGTKLTDTTIDVVYGEEEEPSNVEGDDVKISIGDLLDMVDSSTKLVKVDGKGWREVLDEKSGKICKIICRL